MSTNKVILKPRDSLISHSNKSSACWHWKTKINLTTNSSRFKKTLFLLKNPMCGVSSLKARAFYFFTAVLW